MTPQDLNNELQGYQHARLRQPIASTDEHYLRGYRQGTRDRIQLGSTFDQTFQYFQSLYKHQP